MATYRKQLTFNNAEKDLWDYIHAQDMPAAAFIKLAIREYMKKQEIKDIVEEVLAERAEETPKAQEPKQDVKVNPNNTNNAIYGGGMQF